MDRTTLKSLARNMFLQYPAHEIYQDIDDAYAEASDNQWFYKLWVKDKKFPKKDLDYKPKRKSVIKLNLKREVLKKAINDNLRIVQVAEEQGIKIKNNKALCPFHNDTDPSLIFYPATNTFHCFGCKASGDIIEFIRRMENAV
jgi:hypothetical protein